MEVPCSSTDTSEEGFIEWCMETKYTNTLFTFRQRQWIEVCPPMNNACFSTTVVSSSGGEHFIVIGGQGGGGGGWTATVELFQ